MDLTSHDEVVVGQGIAQDFFSFFMWAITVMGGHVRNKKRMRNEGIFHLCRQTM